MRNGDPRELIMGGKKATIALDRFAAIRFNLYMLSILILPKFRAGTMDSRHSMAHPRFAVYAPPTPHSCVYDASSCTGGTGEDSGLNVIPGA